MIRSPSFRSLAIPFTLAFALAGPAAAVERDIVARDGEGRDQGRRDDIFGRGRDTASERGQGRGRDRDRDRER